MSTLPLDETDHSPVWPVDPGETALGDCLVMERLGVGHRCETWLAWSRDLWAPVAVKVARPHQVDHPRARLSLLREVAALDGLDHPALPRLIADHADHADHEVPYVVVEYVDGPTLADVVDDDGPLSSLETALLGTQLLAAVRLLHRRGLAHLDVKPDNVMLRDGRPVLVDFGSARRLGGRQPAGRPVGTPGYASPEMEACEPIGPAMDLYGLGATLAEAVTGVPFPDVVRLPDTPLGGVVRRLLADDPDERGTLASALVALAAQCADARPWPAWMDRHLD